MNFLPLFDSRKWEPWTNTKWFSKWNQVSMNFTKRLSSVLFWHNCFTFIMGYLFRNDFHDVWLWNDKIFLIYFDDRTVINGDDPSSHLLQLIKLCLIFPWCCGWNYLLSIEFYHRVPSVPQVWMMRLVGTQNLGTVLVYFVNWFAKIGIHCLHWLGLCNFPDVVWNKNCFMMIIYTCIFSCGDLHRVISLLAALAVQNRMSLLSN